jgi:hypothetical protein
MNSSTAPIDDAVLETIAQRAHFHPPPAAQSEDAVPDNPTAHHPSALFTRTLATIRQRIETLWEQR